MENKNKNEKWNKNKNEKWNENKISLSSSTLTLSLFKVSPLEKLTFIFASSSPI